MMDHQYGVIERIFTVYRECQSNNNTWGINYWGHILNHLMREYDARPKNGLPA